MIESLRPAKPYRRLQLTDQTLQKYGLTRKIANDLFERQGYVCAICKTDTRMVVDHDHATQEVRGFLCVNCNLMLGMALDSVPILTGAIAYISNRSARIELPRYAEARRADEAIGEVIADQGLTSTVAKAAKLAEELGIGEEAARSRLRRWSKATGSSTHQQNDQG